MAQIIAVVVPVAVIAARKTLGVHDLANENGRTALRQKQQGETGIDHRPAIERTRSSRPGTIFTLLDDEKLTAFAIPVVAAEKAQPRQPASPFDAIEVVVGCHRLIE